MGKRARAHFPSGSAFPQEAQAFVPVWVATTTTGTVNAALIEYFFQSLQPLAKVLRRFRNLLDSLSYRVILVFGNKPLSELAMGHIVLLTHFGCTSIEAM
jgi:hypothetical protein